MNPRLAGWNVLIKVPRCITLAHSGNPSETFNPSTLVGIDRNVDMTALASMPFSNGVYFFGSHVSVWACPPAIQSRIMASAVALGAGLSSARRGFQEGPPMAVIEAAQARPLRKSRRFVASGLGG